MTHTRLENWLSETVGSSARALMRWTGRRQAARHLSRMPDRLLNDIGVPRSQIRDATRDGSRRAS